MKILCIGNSYSNDATRYLYGIARAGGVSMKVVNLYIGGCSLARHYRNMLGDIADYEFQLDGIPSGIKISIKEALLSDDWDVVTLQQASPQSTKYESYQPYLDRLAEYVRQMAPKAKLYIHQSWGYREGSPRLEKLIRVSTHEEMFRGAKEAYFCAAEAIRADGILPSGEAVALAMKEKTEDMVMHRDEIHLSFGLGRYLAALTWFCTLTGRSVAENTFRDFDEEITEEAVALAKRIAEQIANDYIIFQK
jgi:hypothetical protein